MTRPTAPSFLSGGGELGDQIRSFDWRKTSLGPPGQWSQSLKTAVRIMLTSGQAFWIGWGPDLIYLYNDPYKAIIGGKHPAALGQPTRVVWGEIWDTIGPMLSAAMSGDTGIYVESQLLIMERHGYREETYYTFSFSPVPDDDGNPAGIICANTDDTQRVMAERQLGLLRELATRTADARTWEEACRKGAAALGSDARDLPFALVYVCDDDRARASLVASTGIDPAHVGAVTSIPLDTKSPWPVAEAIARQQLVVVEDLAGKFGAAFPTGAWDESPTAVAVVPMKTAGAHGRNGALVVGLNPFRRLDDAYRRFLGLVAGQLEASIASADAYEHERKRAEGLAELDRAKTAFFSNVSHEFRTPLTLMLGPVEDLLERAHTELSPSTKEQLQVVHRNSLRLLRLVNTMLDFSRIEAGRVCASYEPVALDELTAELASVFRSAIEREGMRLVVECGALTEPTYVDREMWEKIVLNLLSNAFKYTLEGEIRVRLERVDSRARLTVRDTGVGIPQAELGSVFDRFHRVPQSRGRTHEGTGIGLALVHELVRLHGGTVGVESKLDEGSTFIVEIPLGRAHLDPDHVREQGPAHERREGVRVEAFVQEALHWSDEDADEDPWLRGALGETREPSRPMGAATLGPRILLADDNADMREYVARVLGERFEVQSVGDGEAALEAARANRPALILADVMMPRLDGMGLLREIRADARLRDVPVIMLSARAGEEARVEGVEAGADDYLTKPFTARELVARVSAHVHIARARRESGARIREQQDRLRLAMETGRLGAMEIELETGHVACTGQAKANHGLLEDADVDRERLLQLVHPDDRDRVRAAVAHAAESGGEYEEEYRVVWPDDGGVHWILARGRAMARDGATHLVTVTLDITERKVAQQALEASEQRYRTMASTAQAAEEALREAAQRKDEFLATLAHELRNPMAPLRSGLELLEVADDEPEVRARTRATMRRQVTHMVRLVDDLLDVSRISRGTLELRKERVSVREVVERAVETVRPVVEGSEHQVDASFPRATAWVDADPHRLHQAIGNLLHNASKFTPRGGRISVTVRRDDGFVVVDVGDTGVGIDEAEIERVFEMFAQVGRAQPEEDGVLGGGLGIGLTLVRRFVELHGGTVHATSAGRGRGSTFTIRIPLAGPGMAASPSPTGSDGLVDPPRRQRILVVDDNEDAAEMLAALLEHRGHVLASANNGRSAVAVAQEFRPEVILLDIGLPDIDGYEVCRRVRGESWGDEVEIIAVTGWGQDEARDKSSEAGFDHHLVKPIDHAVLAELLARAEDA